MSDFINVTIGAPDNQTAISLSSADRIFVDIAAGFTGSGGGRGGNTDLTTTRTSTTVTVVSSTGTDATIPAADATNAGVMTSAMQTKLAGIEAGAEVNDTASEILAKVITVDGSGSGLDADTLDGVQASALVPYTGASGDVNLGEHGAQVGNLEFDNTPTNTPTTDGSVFWDAGDGTLQLQMKGGVIQQVGMNQFARVYNDTASSFTKGQVVYISGAQGNRIAAKLAQADSELTSRGTIGFVTETIAAGAEGNIIVSGPLYKLSTTGLTAGNPLYLSATTAGQYTETAPQAPNHLVILGYVERVHGSVGSIYVKVDNGYELEELHDVDLTESKATPIDADALLLQDSADSSIWKRLTWANLKATAKAYFDTVYAAIVHTHVIGDVTNLQTTLDGKVDENAAITGATKTKITYDAKGLVTAGADATTADIADSTNKRYVTDAQLTVIGNTSGTNTGDQNIFSKVAVAGQSDVVADSTGDTLTLVAGSNITITTDASTDSVTINSTGGGGVSDGDKGDITVSSSGTVWTVDNAAITNAKLAQVATATFKGRTTAGTGAPEDLTAAQATALLNTFTSSLKGLAPASGGGTTNFLRADGTWAAPAGGGAGDFNTLTNSTTDTGPVNTTTETALFSYSLPTDLVAGETLIMEMAGVILNNSGGNVIYTIKTKIGTTDVITLSNTLAPQANTRHFNIRVLINIGSTSAQRVSYIGWSWPGTVGAYASYPSYGGGFGTAAEDTTSAKTFQVTCAMNAANANAYMYARMSNFFRISAP